MVIVAPSPDSRREGQVNLSAEALPTTTENVACTRRAFALSSMSKRDPWTGASNSSRLPRPSSRLCPPLPVPPWRASKSSCPQPIPEFAVPPHPSHSHHHHPSAIARPRLSLSLLRPPRRPLLFITLLHSLAFGCCWLVPFLRVARTHPQGDDTHTERGKGRRGRGRQPQWARHKRSGGRTHARDSPEIQDPRDPLAPVASQSPERILVHGGRRGARRVL